MKHQILGAQIFKLMAIELFVLTPVAQTFWTRITALTLTLSFLISLIAYAFLPKNIQTDMQSRVNLFIKPKSQTGRWTAGLIISLFLWAIISLIFIFPSISGLRELLIIAGLIFTIIIIANGLDCVPYFFFEKSILSGLCLGCLFLQIVECNPDIIRQHIDEHFMLFDHNRNAASMVIIVFALLCFRLQDLSSKLLVCVTIAIVLGTVFSSKSETAKLAFVTGTIVTFLVYYLPGARKYIFLSMAALFLAMPIITDLIRLIINFLPQVFVEQSHAVHRLEIWANYSNLIVQKPVFGWGMNADKFIGMSGAFATEFAKLGLPANVVSPHNAALEVWVNLGAIGAVLFSIIIFMAFFMSKNASINFQATSTGSAMAVFTILMTGSSFFQGWWLASMVIVTVAYMRLHKDCALKPMT